MYNSGHLGIWKMYLCILKLSFCGFLSKILPLHLTLLSLPHSPSSVPFRQEDCASYLRFSHWLRPSLGENKQTQKQETHLVLISSYGYRLFQFLPGLHCFPMPSDDCSFFFFFPFPKVYSCCLQKGCSDRSYFSVIGNWNRVSTVTWRLATLRTIGKFLL